MSRLILILGDQLSLDIAALKAADKARDAVIMAEVASETDYVPHHPKKITLIFSAMRHFAKMLTDDGWQVDYTTLEDPNNAGSLTVEVLGRAEQHGCTELVVTEPGEWRVIQDLQALPLKVQILPDDRFLANHAEFEAWAKGRKTLRMEYFYREMRRKTGLLMEGDQPAGGKWNFDHDNRKSATTDLLRHKPLAFTPDAITQEVLDLVRARFANHFGDLEPFWFATTRAEALQALDHFAAHLLPHFGDTQDAMLLGDPFLHHSLLSAYINIGLLNPLEVCQRAQAEWLMGRVPINAAEGFIRQIIGWREYIRGIYFLEGPDYIENNCLGHTRPIPQLYWGAPTKMACMEAAVRQTKEQAYAHHIQRLMITGNFALLAGIDPQALHIWYLSVYFDAFEWVEAPNTIGMSQWADGGIIASKPYVSSGAYINRMSDYCKSCAYNVKEKTGAGACPFNVLYWYFLNRHRTRFERNPRMGQMYRTWDRMDTGHRVTVVQDAERLLTQLDDI